MRKSGLVFAAFVLCVLSIPLVVADDVTAEEFFEPCLEGPSGPTGPTGLTGPRVVVVEEDTSVEGTAYLPPGECRIEVAEDVHLHLDDVFVGGFIDGEFPFANVFTVHPTLVFAGEEESSIAIEDSEFWASGFAIHGFHDIYLEDSEVGADGVLIVAHGRDGDTVIDQSVITAAMHMIVVSLAEDDARVRVEDSTLRSTGILSDSPHPGMVEWMEGNAFDGGLGLKCDIFGGGKVIVLALSAGDAETQVDNSLVEALSRWQDDTWIENVNLDQIGDELDTMGLDTNVAISIGGAPHERTPPSGRRVSGVRALSNPGGSGSGPVDDRGENDDIDILEKIHEALGGGLVIVASAALSDADTLIEGGHVAVPEGVAGILAIAIEEAQVLVDNESSLVARIAAIASAAVEDASTTIADRTEINCLGEIFLAVALSLEDARIFVHENHFEVAGLLAIGALSHEDTTTNVKQNDFFGSYLDIFFAFSGDESKVDLFDNLFEETFKVVGISNDEVKATDNEFGAVFVYLVAEECTSEDNSPDVACAPI